MSTTPSPSSILPVFTAQTEPTTANAPRAHCRWIDSSSPSARSTSIDFEGLGHKKIEAIVSDRTGCADSALQPWRWVVWVNRRGDDYDVWEWGNESSELEAKLAAEEIIWALLTGHEKAAYLRRRPDGEN